MVNTAEQHNTSSITETGVDMLRFKFVYGLKSSEPV